MDYPKRKHPRLPQYDYSAAGSYFLTICTKEKRCILGTVGRDDLGAPGSARPTQTVPCMVAAFKRLTNRAAGESLWQSSYYDHVVRNENDFLRIWNYIDTNSARWAEDEYFL